MLLLFFIDTCEAANHRFEFLQKVFLGLMYPFPCVLWVIFWSFARYENVHFVYAT